MWTHVGNMTFDRFEAFAMRRGLYVWRSCYNIGEYVVTLSNATDRPGGHPNSPWSISKHVGTYKCDNVKVWRQS